jgi:hypothetical protein
MSLRAKIAGLLVVTGVAGGGLATVQYVRTSGHEGAESCCHTPPRVDGDPNAGRPLVELEGDDKKLADAQGYCPVMPDTKLGEMGPPVKLTVKGQDGREEPVFVCCKGCKRKALADPDKTLAKVAELKVLTKTEAANPSR